MGAVLLAPGSLEDAGCDEQLRASASGEQPGARSQLFSTPFDFFKLLKISVSGLRASKFNLVVSGLLLFSPFVDLSVHRQNVWDGGSL